MSDGPRTMGIPDPALQHVFDLAASLLTRAELAEREYVALKVLMTTQLKTLSDELDRIARINASEQRERVVPELTVYMWLQSTERILAAIWEPRT